MKKTENVEVISLQQTVDVVDRNGKMHKVCACKITADNVDKEGYYIPNKRKHRGVD